MRKIKLMLAMMLTMAMVVGCRGSQGTKDNQIVENSSKESVETTTEEITTEEPTTVDLQEFDFTMCFAGDILLAEGEITTNNLDSSPNGLKDCISPEFLEIMNRADYTCVNNEFTYRIGRAHV